MASPTPFSARSRELAAGADAASRIARGAGRARTRGSFVATVALGLSLEGRHLTSLHRARAEASTGPTIAARVPSDHEDLAAEDRARLHAREAARRAELATLPRGERDVRDLALDATTTAVPWSLDSAPGASPLAAIDGDDATAWRGRAGASAWIWTLPFRRVAHPALVRALYGDASDRGVPSAYRWEYLAPSSGGCGGASEWRAVPDGAFDDRHPNQFVHGPKDLHARRQALFLDVDACALRLVVHASEGNVPPVVRSIRVLEGAASLTRAPGVRVRASDRLGALAASRAEHVLDGRYVTAWAGEPGRDRWTLDVELPAARVVDRVSLVLGLDAITVPDGERAGRRFGGAYLPTRYRVEVAPDDDASHLAPVPEADPPEEAGRPLPVRRRLVKLATPRLVKRLRLTIADATDGAGSSSPAGRAPVVRDLGIYEAADARPVVGEPLFLSVDANPAPLAQRSKWGQVATDGLFARDLDHRLRRALVGFDTDTGWTADVSRKRDLGAGRFLEAIEGDDPTLDRALVAATSPPPVVVLSGSLDWEFDDRTAEPPKATLPWQWNALAPAGTPDGGIGQLASVVRDRATPMIGFCGGADLLAMLEASSRLPGAETLDVVDAVVARNVNQPIRPMLVQRSLYEHAWWTDRPARDASRPVIRFDPRDPLFAFVAATRDRDEGGDERAESRELPVSHVDMLRGSAFAPGGPLDRLVPVASSSFCRPFVDAAGPEPTFADPADPERVCVRVPQAYRSRDADGYPVVGFQFHPEQRDLTRLAPGSPRDARGDAMNVLANTVDLVLDAYVRRFWPHA